MKFLMVMLLAIYSFLFSFAVINNANAAMSFVGEQEVINISGIKKLIPSGSSLLVLSGATTASPAFQTLYKDNAFYTVSSGKTLYIIAADCRGTSSPLYVNLGDGSTATGVNNSGTKPTGGTTKMCGTPAATDVGGATGSCLTVGSSLTPQTSQVAAIYATVAAGNKPYYVASTAGNSYCTFYGYEQ